MNLPTPTTQQIADHINREIDFAQARHAVMATLSIMYERGYLLGPVFDKLVVNALRCPSTFALCDFAMMLKDIVDERHASKAHTN